MITEQEIAFFLAFGFLPRVDNTWPKWLGGEAQLATLQRQSVMPNAASAGLLEQGMSALDAGFDDLATGLQVLPLSGGLDSRLILSELLARDQRENLVTVTIGVPGTYDYELAKQLAAKYQVRHEPIDLNAIRLQREDLANVARHGCGWTFLIDGYYHSLMHRTFGRDATYWSGFMGGELAGAHTLEQPSQSWSEAKQRFVGWNRLTDWHTYGPNDFDPVTAIAADSFVAPSVLGFDDQLDFGIRQNNYIRNVVLFDGYHYRTPFLAPPWVQFILGLPRINRIDKRLFKQLLLKKDPEMFNMPTANNYGGGLAQDRRALTARKGLNRVRNRLLRKYFGTGKADRLASRLFETMGIYQAANYLNFDVAFRSRDDYRTLAAEAIESLQQQQVVPWLDLAGIQRQHLSGGANHGLMICLITALDVSLSLDAVNADNLAQ